MGAGDHHAQVLQRPGDVVQEAGAIAAVDLDHGMGPAGVVVGQHPGLDLKHIRSRRQRAAAGQRPVEPQLALQRQLDVAPDALEPLRIGDGGAIVGVLDTEAVERHAVAGGEDPGVDDAGAGERDGACHFHEQTGMVRGEQQHLGAVAEAVDLEVEGQLSATLLRGAHQLGMAPVHVGGEAQPVARVLTLDEGAHRLVRPAAQRLRERLLSGRDAFPAAAGIGARKRRVGLVIQGAQELTLPAVPDAWPDRADVGGGHDQEQAQALGRLDHLGHVAHRLGIVGVALERGSAQQQMMAHQPRHGLHLLGAQAQTRPGPLDHARANLGMIAGAALAEVVEQHRDVQLGARENVRHQAGDEGQLVGEKAVLDLIQHADRLDRVLVHRVDVIEAVLHLGDHAAELRQEPAEHAGLVHPAQRGVRVLARGEHGHEQGVRRRVGALVRTDPPQVLGHRAQRLGVDVEVPLLRQVEQPEHRQGLALEQIGLGGRDPAALDLHAVDPPPPEAEPGKTQARPAPVLLLEGGAEDPGQRADLLGDQVVMLHEPLDAARPLVVPVTQMLGDLRLQVEGQALLGPVAQIVEVAAHRPEEPPGLGELAQRQGIQNAVLDQLRRPLDPVEEPAEPEQGLEIAQAALAFLDVGLEQVAAVAGALVAGVALRELGLDEGGAATGDHLGLEAPLKLLEQRGIAPQEARLEQVGAGRQVGARAAHALGDGAGRLTDLEAEIPQPVEQELDHLLGMGGPLVGVQEQEIDVGVRRQLGAPIAADRDHREPLALGWIGEAEHLGQRVVQKTLDQVVDQAAVVGDRGLGVVVGVEPRPDAGTPAIEPGAQPAQQRRLIGAAAFQQLLEPGARLREVDHRRRTGRLSLPLELDGSAHARTHKSRPCSGYRAKPRARRATTAPLRSQPPARRSSRRQAGCDLARSRLR